MYNILVCDDDKEIVNAIAIYLSKEGYNILKAYNGKEALKLIANNEIHLIILDIMMPEMDGMEVANEVRKTQSIPILMLSAKSEDYDKVAGLNNGADDYVTKPFNPIELIARVNSQIRRYTRLGTIADKEDKDFNVFKTGELIIKDDIKQVTVEGKEIKLTPTEYVWEDEAYGADNIIAVHIRHIREKIEINPKEPKYLKVIWGIGYKIEKID